MEMMLYWEEKEERKSNQMESKRWVEEEGKRKMAEEEARK